MMLERLCLEANYQWRYSSLASVRWTHNMWDLTCSDSSVQIDCQLGSTDEILRYEGPKAGACKINMEGTRAVDRDANPVVKMQAVTRPRDVWSDMNGDTLSFLMPMRVNWVADRIDSPEVIAGMISRRDRDNFKSIMRKRGYYLTPTLDQAAFEDFYDNMYLPTMQSRHGERAKGETRATARECMFRHKGALLLMRDSERRVVGGVLCRYSDNNRRLVMRLTGVRDADPSLYQDGSFKAMWILVLRWASSQGLHAVDLERTEPFISNGNFQWKKRLGASLELQRNFMSKHRILLTVNSEVTAGRDFLTSHPLVEITNTGELGAVCFYSREIEALPSRYCSARGLSRIRYLDLDTMRWSSEILNTTK